MERVGAAGSGRAGGATLACAVCGQGLAAGHPCPNGWCRRPDRAFSVVFGIGTYEAALRGAIVRYKYRGEKGLAVLFARMVARHLDAHAPWFEEFDLVTAVPAYSGPNARRDWDPVGRITAELAPMLDPGWDVACGVVVKRFETPAMQGQDWATRRRIAAGPLRRSLVVRSPGTVAGARVLLLDDVLTDGSTLREVARALRAAGAREVAGLVLARHRWEWGPGDAP